MSEHCLSSQSNISTSISISDSFDSNHPYINEKLLKKVCILLKALIKLKPNKIKGNKFKKLDAFNLKGIPSMSLYDYLYRIVKYTKIRDNTLITALIYIDIICTKNKFNFNHYSIYKLLFISIILASKHCSDNYCSKKLYSEIGGVQVKELELLEKKFSLLLKFKFSLEKILVDKYNEYINNDHVFYYIESD